MEGVGVELGSSESATVEPNEVRSRIDPRTGKRQLLHPASYWRDHEARRKASGESLVRYCQVNGLALATFRRWNARLEGRDTRKSRATGRKPVSLPAQAQQQAAGFLSMPIRAPSSPLMQVGARTAPIEIDAGGGLTVRLYDEAARSALDAVLSRLVTGR